MVAFGEYVDDGTASAIKARDYKDATDLVAHSLRAEGFDASEDGTGRGTPLVPCVAGTMKSCKDSGGWTNSADHAAAGYMLPVMREVAPALTSNYGKQPDNSDTNAGPMLVPVANTLASYEGRCQIEQTYVPVGFDTYNQTVSDVAHTLRVATDNGLQSTPHVLQPVGFYANMGTQGGGVEVGLSPTLKAHPKTSNLAAVAFHNRQDPDVSGPVTHPLGAQDNGMAVCFDTTQVTSKHNYSNPKPGDPCHPLASSAHPPAVAFSAMPMNSGKNYTVRPTDVAQPLTTVQAGNHNQGGDFVLAPTMSVRRLTPRECERLQGFPDDYTQIPFRNKPAADGPRYKALGNSMAVNVMAWIGSRIQEVSNG